MKQNTAANPHGLTHRQVEVMDALVLKGTSKDAAKHLDVNKRTIDTLARIAVQKIGARNRPLALLAWDRLKRQPVVFGGQRPVSSVFDLGNERAAA